MHLNANKPIHPRLGQDEKVYINGRLYRAELWHTPKGIEYELWDDSKKTFFTRTIQQVSDAIKDKKIKRL